MTTADELRRCSARSAPDVPAGQIGIDPEKHGLQIEAVGFTSAWFGGTNSAANLAVVEPMPSSTGRLVLGTGIASVWTWEPSQLRGRGGPAGCDLPGALHPGPRCQSRAAG